MEVEQQVQTEVTNVGERNFADKFAAGETPEAVKPEPKNFADKFSTPDHQEAAKPESNTKESVVGAASEEKPVIPAYSPNYKFSVMDKEHEFDEFLRGSIKDAESEKKLRELYEKAYGLDYAKPKHAKTLEDNKKYIQELGKYEDSVAEIRHYFNNNDFDNLFKRLDIPEEKVVQWLLNKVEYEKLPPDMKAAMDSNKAHSQKLWDAEQRAARNEQQLQEISAQAKVQELRYMLDQPNIKGFVSKFESLPGKKTGDFWNEVCDYGDYVYTKTGQDLSGKQAIEAVMQRYAYISSLPMAASQQAAPAAQEQAAPKKEVPVIPAINGQSGASPARQRPKSLDDLRKIKASLSG